MIPWQTPGVPRKSHDVSASQTFPAIKPSQSSPSLKALAGHLGLSTAAVSRVLNGVPAARSIPAATQNRIFAAAKALNYRPNLSARSLRNRRSQTIGVLVPEVSEGYATLVLSGIERHLLQAGYLHFLVSHGHRPEMIDRAQSLLFDRSVEGIIAIDTLLPHRCAVPTVTVSGHHEPEGITNIVLNHRQAAELALTHLHSLGHRRIAFLKGQPFSSDSEARWRAIRHAASRLAIEISPGLVAQLEGDLPTHEPGYLATRRLLASGHPFTGIFAFNDISAMGAIRALREAGLRVPADVSVVGFDDVQSAAFNNPALTTIRQPLHDMGVLAATTVLANINAETAAFAQLHPPASRLIVDPDLVIRESTAAAPRIPARRLRSPAPTTA